MSDNKPAQVLLLEPAKELVFQGPFTDVVNAQMTLKNPTDRPVCFKVKTTAPKQYCVRPNSGIISPLCVKTITVMLQPIEVVPNEVSRHKFMVQTCFCPPGDVDLDSLWKTISPSELMYSKLMVVFEQRSSVDNEVIAVAKEEAPSAVQYSSPTSTTPSRGSVNNVGNVYLSELQDKLRNETDARIKAEKDKAVLQKDLDELFKKHAKLQQVAQGGSMSELGVPTIQVILLAIAALLIGLIVGKLF